jgi:glycogen synthase
MKIQAHITLMLGIYLNKKKVAISGSKGTSMKKTVFWDDTAFSLVEIYRRFRDA